jgi:hypothetical protein
MAKRLKYVLILAAVLCMVFSPGCATSAQTGAAIGCAGGVVIGAVTGGAGGAVVGGLIGAGGGYIVGNEASQ